MDWRDTGILLSSRRHGESSMIIDVFTPEHGRHSGVVRGGASRKVAPILQPGAQLDLAWRARLEEHIGSFTVELQRSRAAIAMQDRTILAGSERGCCPFVVCPARTRGASRALCANPDLAGSAGQNGPLAAGLSAMGNRAAGGDGIRPRPSMLRRHRSRGWPGLCLAKIRARRVSAGRRGLGGPDAASASCSQGRRRCHRSGDRGAALRHGVFPRTQARGRPRQPLPAARARFIDLLPARVSRPGDHDVAGLDARIEMRPRARRVMTTRFVIDAAGKPETHQARRCVWPGLERFAVDLVPHPGSQNSAGPFRAERASSGAQRQVSRPHRSGQTVAAGEIKPPRLFSCGKPR